ncbi:signal transduction histidine kinase [Bacilli bacterium PM5-3]|nr:signal transduction histidine kinase [Bacilli bacterium PM5-3]MDH6603844.1 signal transduction histidine kinase [Bacilli bacterium PM5-9]
MKSNKKWRLFFALSIILYFCAVLISGVIINEIPNLYSKLQVSNNKKIEQTITSYLENNNFNNLETLNKENTIDFVVINKKTNEILYSSIENLNEDNIELLNDNANEKLISSRTVFDVDSSNVEYEVILISYYISPQDTFDIWIIALLIIISILLSLIAIALMVLFHKYIKPLHSLKDTIQKVSAFQLNFLNKSKNNSEYGDLTKQLIDFSQELDQNIKNTGYQYSQLEKSLMIQNEETNYKNKLLGSLAHDLKAPLALINLNIEKLSLTSNESESIIYEKIQNQIQDVVEDINDMNTIVFDSHNNSVDHIEKIDLVSLILDCYQVINDLFDSKNFKVEFAMDEEVIIEANLIRMKQLINNAYLNIYNHALMNAEVVVSCYKENDKIIMSFYNDAKQLSQEQLQKVFNVFYSADDNNGNSGIGLYTMKIIAEEINGQISMKNQGDGIVIEVVI